MAKGDPCPNHEECKGKQEIAGVCRYCYDHNRKGHKSRRVGRPPGVKNSTPRRDVGRPKSPLPADVLAMARAVYAVGDKSVREVAASLNLDEGKLYREFRRNGVEMRKVGRPQTGEERPAPKTCKFCDSDKEVVAHDRCGTCYQRWYRENR